MDRGNGFILGPHLRNTIPKTSPGTLDIPRIRQVPDKNIRVFLATKGALSARSTRIWPFQRAISALLGSTLNRKDLPGEDEPK